VLTVETGKPTTGIGADAKISKTAIFLKWEYHHAESLHHRFPAWK